MAERCQQTKDVTHLLQSLGLRSRNSTQNGKLVPKDYVVRTESKRIAGGREYGAAFAHSRSKRFREVVAANIDLLLQNHISVTEFRRKDGSYVDFVLKTQWNASYKLIEY